AHFLICYTALLIYRLIEVKIEKAGGSHHTIDSIIETLRNLNVVKDSETIYKSVYTGSTVLDDLNKAFNSDLGKQYYRNTTLNRFKKHIGRKE
ncbi:MAG: transposase, partial [Lachnospiraceae bacterium]|nr:transposase [Lachnospiraceae bacterium]